MAQEPERIDFRAEQYHSTVRVYHTKYLLARGATDILEAGDNLADTENLTDLGRTVLERLLAHPGIIEIVVINYHLAVAKHPALMWADQGDESGLDRFVLIQLGGTIASSMQAHHQSLAELMGDNPDNLPDLDLQIHISGDRPIDQPLPLTGFSPGEGQAA